MDVFYIIYVAQMALIAQSVSFTDSKKTMETQEQLVKSVPS